MKKMIKNKFAALALSAVILAVILGLGMSIAGIVAYIITGDTATNKFTVEDNIDYVDFTVTKANRHKIGYTDETTDLVIPATFYDEEDQTWYRVVEIEGKYWSYSTNCAFAGSTNLVSVTIPDTVTTIGPYVFYGCTGLESIVIPDSVTTLDSGAFEGCSSLASATIGKGVTIVSGGLFNNCTSLANVKLAGNINVIYANAFANCDSLTNIDIPNSVETIDSRAFADSGLTSITIPAGVTSITGNVFCSCSNLTSIEVDSDNENYCSVDGVLYDKNKQTLIAYPIGNQSESFRVPSGVTSIGGSSFCDCTNLESITIPNSVTSIGSGAFQNCTTMTDLYFIGTSEQWHGIMSRGSGWKENCPVTIHIHGQYNETAVETTPQNVNYVAGMDFNKTGMVVTVRYISGCCSKVLQDDEYTVLNGEDLEADQTSVTISYTDENGITVTKDVEITVAADYTDFTVTKANRHKIGYTDETTDLVIPATFYDEEDQTWYRVTEIAGYFYPGGDAAFPYCTNLTSLTIPDSVTSIGNYAIYGATNLTSVTTGNGVTSIGTQAFYGCTSLNNVALGDSLETLGDSAFYNCTNLTSITIPDSVTSIGNSTFRNCTNLTSVTTGHGFTSIGPYAFSDCTSLTNITLGDSLKTIGNSAFASCTNLKSVTIPSTVTTISGQAFTNTGLSSIIIPENVKDLGYASSEGFGAFNGCTSLLSIEVSSDNPNYCSVDGVLYSKDMATLLCYPAGKTSASLTIPDSVLYIGKYAAYGATSLTEIIFGEAIESIETNAFYAGDSDPLDTTIRGGNDIVLSYSWSDDNRLVYWDGEPPVIPAGGTYYVGVTSTTVGDYSGATATYTAGDPFPFVPQDGDIYVYGDYEYRYNQKVTRASNNGTTFYRKVANDSTIGGWNPNVIDATKTSYGALLYNINGKPVQTIKSTYILCSNLTSIVIPRSIGKIVGAFFDCTSLKSVTIPNSVTFISDNTFNNCTSLTSVTIPDSVTSIEVDTFSNCTSLESITIPDSVTTIGGSAFYGCTSLESVTIPDSVTSIGDRAFYGCTSLESVTIPDSMTTIGGSTFYSCTNLTSITIPSSVTSIGSYAFCHCNGLTDIYFTGTEDEWNAIEFGASWNANCPVTIYFMTEYIQNTSTAWLDTGLTINKTDSAEYILYANLSNTSWGGANGYLQFNMQGIEQYLNQWAEIRVVYDGTTYTRSLYINGELYGTNDWSSLDWSNVKIGIFALGDKDNTWYSQQPQTGLVQSCKIYKNGELVRDYVAAKSSTGVYGLYDQVNHTFNDSDGYTVFSGS